MNISQQSSRSTAQRVLRRINAGVLVVMATAALAVPAYTHTAPVGGYHHMGPAAAALFWQSRADHPVNVPAWTSATAHQFPGCAAVQDGVLYDDVVVVKSDASTVRVSFDRAWALGHDDERANDVWVVGGCTR